MKLIVNAHNIELIKEETVNEKEINISKCTFEFSEEYGDNLVKEAYFTLEGETYKQIIVNNECSYPPEVLVKTGTVELGVVAYDIAGSEYIERFNPSPVYFQTVIGSLKDHAENSQEITPSEMEQFEQALEEGLAEVQNVDIDASKEDNTATITITNRYGVEKSVEIYDGEKGEDGEPGITPNIQVGTTTTLPAGSNAIVTQRGTTENPIFDFGIPKGEDGQSGGSNDYTELSNKPKINNVELNGNKTTSDLGINIPDVSNFITKDVNDLTNYYKKTETYTKTEVDNKVSSVYRYRGTVATYSDLPSTDLVIGDVYNIEQADSQHGIEAGDNVAWTGTAWDKLSGNVDLSGYQPLLVSGTNIKTIDDESLMGSGNILNTYILPKSGLTNAAVISKVDEAYQKFKNGQHINLYGTVAVSNCDVLIPLTFNTTSSSVSLNSGYYITEISSANKKLGRTLYYQLTLTDGHITYIIRYIREVDISDGTGFILKTDNSASYTPTANSYNPATTKYVDDKVASSSPSHYIVGDYLIYTLSVGNYKVTPSSTSWNTNTGLPLSELTEAITLAYNNNKKLILNIYTTNSTECVSYFFASSINTTSTSMGGTAHLISTNGNICETILNLTYSYSNNEFDVSGTSVKATSQLSIGTSNTYAYTPTAATHPATKGYVDSIAIPTSVTNAETTYTISSLTGNYSYKLGEITSLTITATTASDLETVIYFESGSTPTDISMPDTITNLGDAPTMTTASNVNTGTCEASKNYIISVLNNIAIWKAY